MLVSHNGNVAALAASCLAALMFGLEISTVPVILPVLQGVLHADFKDMQWIMNAYTIACTTVLMAAGTLADRFGRRRVFVVTIVAFAATTLLCGLAPSTQILIVSRFLQGMAGGAMFICSIAILSHAFQDGAGRGHAFAIWGVVAGIGLGFGPLIGGAALGLSSWRAVFLIHVPIAIVCGVLARAGITESRDPHAGDLDVAGIVTLTLAVFGLTYDITQGADLGVTRAMVIAAIAALSFAAFIVVENLTAHPMFDFSVFRIRNFSGAIIACIGMNFSYWPFIIFLPIYLSAALGYDSTTTGLALLVYTIPFLVMPPVAQYLLLSYQARIVIPLGLFTIGPGFVTMAAGISGANAPVVLSGALIAGIGLGLTTTPATNMTTGSVPANRAGMASGLDVSARLITLAINIAVMGLILVEGILSSLRSTLAPAHGADELRALAETIAAGSISLLRSGGPASPLVPEGVAQAALAQGFGWVTLYGGIGVWILAALSFVVFGPQRRQMVPAALDPQPDGLAPLQPLVDASPDRARGQLADM